MQLSFEYFLLSLITSLATLQIVAISKKRSAWVILRNEKATLALSLALIIGSFFWFFSVRDRNVQTFLEGAQLSLIFGAGAFLSLVLTKFLAVGHGSNKT